eukprot:gene10229-11278_t
MLHASSAWAKANYFQSNSKIRKFPALLSTKRWLSNEQRRLNEINIQMLSKNLHEQIFNVKQSERDLKIDLGKIKDHLSQHGLWGKECTILDDIDIELPKFLGKDISEHFENIAKEQSADYFNMAVNMANAKIPPLPREWHFQAGWTKYDVNGEIFSVDCLDADVFVFDVEVCINENELPVIATAVSEHAWYCWVSKTLVDESSAFQYTSRISPNDFICLEDAKSSTPSKRLVIGHNVGYDRSYVKEQYFMKKSPTMFLDTMSMHMCISGLTGIQRILMNSKESKRADWMDVGSLNNLSDVYELYTANNKLDKSMRDLFVHGTMKDIRDDFQSCVNYCASDVKATQEIFAKLWPEFLEHAPHPVTFAGMLEMGSAYLPIDDSWEQYIQDSKETYDDLEDEMKNTLMKLAEDSCRSIENKRYQQDPWLWSLDWTVQKLSLKKEAKKPAKKRKSKKVDLKDEEQKSEEPAVIVANLANMSAEELMDEDIEKWYPDIPSADTVMFKRRQHLPGFPTWYRNLCKKRSNVDWEPGPALISPQTRYAPLLLRMTWDGYPLFFSGRYGWGYLVPGRRDNLGTQAFDPPPNKKARKKKGAVLVGLSDEYSAENGEDESSSIDADTVFPTESFQDLFLKNRIPEHITKYSDEDIMNLSEGDILHHEGIGYLNEATGMPDGIGPFNDVNLPGVWFFKIPHKNGDQFRCGNPLGKDYLSKMENGTLASAGDYNATRTLQTNKMISFWRNAQKRICSQMTVYLNENHLSDDLKRSGDYDADKHYGAILPRVITAGTVTRRAVEITWLTASNPQIDRVGSELKAMVRAPPGHCFVGADVDSQELWIAAILGDAKFAGIHGCTAFGWMTLQGKKSDGTDLHSKTASTIEISRDNAKFILSVQQRPLYVVVLPWNDNITGTSGTRATICCRWSAILNYGRIYGAGQRYAKQLLMQFNHRLTEEDAEMKAAQLFKSTKGTIRYELTEYGHALAEQHDVTVNPSGSNDAKVFREILRKARIYRKNERNVGLRRWTNGSESEMFNKLEDIAVSNEPRTPVLNCKISRALDPNVVREEVCVVLLIIVSRA